MIRASTMVLCLVVSPGLVSAAGGEVACRGTVVDGAGKPLSDVAVRLYDVTIGMEGFKAAPAGETATKSDGTFLLTHRPADPGQLGCTGMILANKPGLAIDWANWHYEADLELRLTLSQPATLAGRVVDETGKGIAEAEVGAFLIAAGKDSQTEPRVTYGLPPADWIGAKTDAEGRFCFANLPADCTGELLAWAPGRAKVFTLQDRKDATRGQFAPGAKDVGITLPAEAVIDGRVVDKERGEGIAGLGLFVRSERVASYIESSPMVSGSDGHFRFSGLRPGHYQLELVPAAPSGSAWVAEPVHIALAAGEAKAGVTFELLKAGVMEVLVTDAVTNEPLEGASVWMVNQENQQYVYGVAGKDGVARIVAVPGRYVGESLRLGQERVYEFDREVTIAAGQVSRLTAQLGQPLMLQGLVLDPNGQPVVNADVKLYPSAERVVRSDLMGRFRLPVHLQLWQVAGQRGLLLFVKQDKRNLSALMDLDENARTVEVRLAPSAVVAGKVLGQDGKALGRAQVIVELALATGEFVTIEVAKCGEDGSYEVSGIPLGRAYRLSVRDVPGYGPGQVDLMIAEDHKGRVESPDLVLPVADAFISGIVVDEDGLPLAGARVFTHGLGQPSRHGLTDEQGRFRLEGVCKGRVHLYSEAAGPGRVAGSGVFDVGAAEARIVARRATSQAATEPSYHSAAPTAPPGSAAK